MMTDGNSSISRYTYFPITLPHANYDVSFEEDLKMIPSANTWSAHV